LKTVIAPMSPVQTQPNAPSFGMAQKIPARLPSEQIGARSLDLDSVPGPQDCCRSSVPRSTALAAAWASRPS